VIARLLPEVSPADAVVATGISHFTVNYYLDQMNAQTGPRYVFPAVQMTRPSCIDPEKLWEDQEELEREAAFVPERRIPVRQHPWGPVTRVDVYRRP
jgi:hypothetical protein